MNENRIRESKEYAMLRILQELQKLLLNWEAKEMMDKVCESAYPSPIGMLVDFLYNDLEHQSSKYRKFSQVSELLEKLGYISITEDKEDITRKNVVLTAKGKIYCAYYPDAEKELIDLKRLL